MMMAFLLESPETSQSITRDKECVHVSVSSPPFIKPLDASSPWGSNLRTLPNPNHFPVALTQPQVLTLSTPHNGWVRWCARL